MAGTLTVTREPIKFKYSGKIVERIHIAWTSTAGGATDVLIPDVFGYILKLVTDPVDGPTDNYDVTLIDEYGADVLATTGTNRDTTNSETVYPNVSGATIPAFSVGDVTFTVANAGSAKSGVAVLYVAECL